MRISDPVGATRRVTWREGRRNGRVDWPGNSQNKVTYVYMGKNNLLFGSQCFQEYFGESDSRRPCQGRLAFQGGPDVRLDQQEECYLD